MTKLNIFGYWFDLLKEHIIVKVNSIKASNLWSYTLKKRFESGWINCRPKVNLIDVRCICWVYLYYFSKYFSAA